MSGNRTIRPLVILSTVALLIIISVSHFIGWGTLFDAKKCHFWRALGFPCPNDVQVVHSIYHRGKTSWQDPNYFYLELMPSENSTVLKRLVTKNGLVLIQISGVLPPYSDDPAWFAPGFSQKSPVATRDSYEVWTTTNRHTAFQVLRNKNDGRLFIFGDIYRM